MEDQHHKCYSSRSNELLVVSLKMWRMDIFVRHNSGKRKNTVGHCWCNGEPTLLVHCLYQMLPLNHKRTTSSLAPPIICVPKKIGNKKIEGSPIKLTLLFWKKCIFIRIYFCSQYFFQKFNFFITFHFM